MAIDDNIKLGTFHRTVAVVHAYICTDLACNICLLVDILLNIPLK